jgi:hypothetical protein
VAKASDNVFPKLIESMQTADPAAPSDSSWKVYAKAGGIYARSSNSVVGPFGTVGGSGATGSEVKLSADVTMSSINTFYDGPSVSLNGTYVLLAQVAFMTTAADDATVKLWNGTTVSASAPLTLRTNTDHGTVTLIGYVVTSGSETWKVSAASIGGTMTMKAAATNNGAGNNATKIVPLKIA